MTIHMQLAKEKKDSEQVLKHIPIQRQLMQ